MANMTWAGAVLWVPLVIGVPSLARATTPPPGFVLQETITLTTALTTEGAAQVSSTSLISGVTYKIRTSGIFSIAGPDPSVCPFADAEFARFDSGGGNGCGIFQDSAQGVDLGVAINDSVLDASKFPTWGPYTTSHEYTIDFVGAGGPISLTYHDLSGAYGDNSGSLTVEIFAPATPVPTLTGWAQILLVGLLVASGLWVLRRRRLA